MTNLEHLENDASPISQSVSSTDDSLANSPHDNTLSDIISTVTAPFSRAWLTSMVDSTDTYSESETNDTEESLLTDGDDTGLNTSLVSRKKRIKRDSSHKPTLKDLQLVGDILFTETPTVGYSMEEQKELIALGDVSKLDHQGRTSLFEKGVQFERKGKPGLALQCYLACIQGLDGEVGNFPQLPLCLRHIARLYFAEEEYEKAVHFVQAEKLYYETALLGMDDTVETEQDLPKPPKADNLKHMMIARAIEFEQLSEMCLENKNIGLALDYIGKAAKINESVHGKDDHRSRHTYEKFSYIYAESGKIQYNDALLRFQRKASLPASPARREIAPEEIEEVYTPEQTLAQKVFSISLLAIFLLIIIMEVTLVILSFSKGYLYVPSTQEITNVLSFIWRRVKWEEHVEL